MPAQRRVDLIPATPTRPEEMQLLCLGLSRTATMSLREALQILGYKTYHYIEQRKHIKDEHTLCWGEGMRAKLFNEGEVYGREEFDKLLGQYNAVTDAPCVNHALELIKAYPNAKVVLNTRDVDKWLASMETSYYRILSRKWLLVLAVVDERVRRHLDLLRYCIMDWSDGDWENRDKLRQGFLDHYNKVRAAVPKDRLLEHVPQEGWGPLCAFLGKEVPNQPYPRVNEGNAAFNIHIPLFWIRLFAVLIKWSAPVLVAGLLVWVYRRIY